MFLSVPRLTGCGFQNIPSDALAYRSGGVRCGQNIARIRDSFGLNKSWQTTPMGPSSSTRRRCHDGMPTSSRNHSLRGILFIFLL